MPKITGCAGSRPLNFKFSTYVVAEVDRIQVNNAEHRTSDNARRCFLVMATFSWTSTSSFNFRHFFLLRVACVPLIFQERKGLSLSFRYRFSLTVFCTITTFREKYKLEVIPMSD